MMTINIVNAAGETTSPGIPGIRIKLADGSAMFIDRALVGYITIDDEVETDGEKAAGKKVWVVAIHDFNHSEDMESGWTGFYDGQVVVDESIGYASDMEWGGPETIAFDVIDPNTIFAANIAFGDENHEIVIGDNTNTVLGNNTSPMRAITRVPSETVQLGISEDLTTVTVTPIDAAA